jgi:exosortase/archaeosortase family protein
MPRGWLWRVAFFVTFFLALQAGWSGLQGSTIERLVIDQVTVKTAVLLADSLSPEIGVRADGPRMTAQGGGINIINGCDGTDVAFLLTAAVLVAPVAWRWRLVGLVAGWPFVFVLNQVRVLALFYAFRHDRSTFDLLHGAIAPLALILAVGLFFMFWLGRSGAGGGAPSPS